MHWSFIVLAAILLGHLIANCFKSFRETDFYRYPFSNIKNGMESVKTFRNLIENIILLCILVPISIILIALVPFLKLIEWFFRDKSESKPEYSPKPALKPNKFRDYKPAGEWEPEKTGIRIYLRTTLPFVPVGRQIIYLENEYDPLFNQYIRDNLEELIAFFAERSYEFCYLPDICRKLNDEAFVRYRNPGAVDAIVQEVAIGNDALLPYILKDDVKNIRPCFIRFNGLENPYSKEAEAKIVDGEDVYEFSCFELSPPAQVPLERQIQWYRGKIGHKDLLYNLAKGEDADDRFSRQVLDLMGEIRERVKQLRQEGVSEMVLNSLFAPDNTLSRLHITADNRLLLTDYHNMEIKMFPLPKAVFFLFLRHSEGIAFKELGDYKEELLTIYRTLSGRQCNKKIRQSIEDVTNPLNNSINEKCARIREAFVAQFDDRIAHHYYVTGERGMPKKITLPRTLVECDVAGWI